MNVGRRWWLFDLHLFCIACCLLSSHSTLGLEILSKSKIEKCEKSSASDALNCTNKLVLNLGVPTESSGGEASIVAELSQVENDSLNAMQVIRSPATITVNKSAAYALFDITYERDVPYRPVEYSFLTHRCEPDASARVVGICERLRDGNGNYIEATKPTCCPCNEWKRDQASCGNFFDNLLRGKKNTAHCVRFPGDWFHVYRIGSRSIGFTIRIEITEGSRKSEVIIGPEMRTALSADNFLRVNIMGDFFGYKSIPDLQDKYLVIPKQDPAGLPQTFGGNYSKWMVLKDDHFTPDGSQCDKIGVSYEAFNNQIDFCSSPMESCLKQQLWTFWESDQTRKKNHLEPEYVIEGKYVRINEHPNAGTESFSIGITETLFTDMMIELNADDIEFVYQRSPGKIINVTIPTFESLTQFGTASIATKNTGKLEAAYSLGFRCSEGVNYMEEQFFVMKAEESSTRVFQVYLTTDHAATYNCTAILSDSSFNETDRAECQFTTVTTILNNGSLITPDFGPRKDEHKGVFGSFGEMWSSLLGGLFDFITGKSCRSNCSSFFDLSCHIQYICLSWLAMSFIFSMLFPAVTVLVWLLHQKGFFDPLYDWWEDYSSVLPTNEHDTKRYRHHDYNIYNDNRREERRHIRIDQYSDEHHGKHDHLHHHHHEHHHHHQSYQRKPSLDHFGHAHSLSSKGKHNRMERRDFEDKRSHYRNQEDILSKKGMPRNPRTNAPSEDQIRKQKHGEKVDDLFPKFKTNRRV